MTTPTPSPTDALQKARELEKMRKILHYINENDVVTWHALADKHLREVLTYCDSQASLCLEQAEEIKRLREVVDEAAESLNHVRNIAYSSDDHRIMNIAEDGLKKLRPFLPSL